MNNITEEQLDGMNHWDVSHSEFVTLKALARKGLQLQCEIELVKTGARVNEHGLTSQITILQNSLEAAKLDTERLIQLCRDAHSVIDGLMGDSDLDSDESKEMKVMQQLSHAINAESRQRLDAREKKLEEAVSNITLNFNDTIDENTKKFVKRLIDSGWAERDAKREACEMLHKNYRRQASYNFFTDYQHFYCNACGRTSNRNVKTDEWTSDHFKGEIKWKERSKEQ